jgi:hypothetical protein
MRQQAAGNSKKQNSDPKLLSVAYCLLPIL